MLLNVDAFHACLHLNISMTLKRVGIDLWRHKSARNAASMHHQSAHNREISVFEFLLTRVGESWNHSHDRGILYSHQHSNLMPSIIPCYSFLWNWCKIGRTEYEVCSMFYGAVWKISVQLHLPGSTETLAEYILFMLWHHSVLCCMQLSYTHVYRKHTSIRFGKHRAEDKLTDWQSVKQSQSDYIRLDFIRRKATMWQCLTVVVVCPC